MNTIISYGIFFVVLLACELIYFKIADKRNIIDKQNERRLHYTIVLRGGVIYVLSMFVLAGACVLGSGDGMCIEMVVEYLLAAVIGISFVFCHRLHLIVALLLQAVAYVLFKKKYYHLHEEYLASLNK